MTDRATLESRLEAGKTTKERVTLAAFLGHAAARELVGDDVPQEPQGFFDDDVSEEWFEILEDLGGSDAIQRATPAIATLIEEEAEEMNEGPAPYVGHWFDHAYSWFDGPEHCPISTRIWAELGKEYMESYAKLDDEQEAERDQIYEKVQLTGTKIMKAAIAKAVIPWALGEA